MYIIFNPRKLRHVHAKRDLRAAGVDRELNEGASELRNEPSRPGWDQGPHDGDSKMPSTAVYRLRDQLPQCRCCMYHVINLKKFESCSICLILI